MKKRLLWILPVALLLIFLIGLGLWLDWNAPGIPPVEVPPSTSQTQEPAESTDGTKPSEPIEGATSETGPQESTLPSQTEPSSETEPTDSTQPTEKPTQPTEPPVSEPDDGLADKKARIDALVAEVYALRDYYTAQLLALEASAIAQYEALSPEERTPQRKEDIALNCIDAAYALENECDARMDAICQELSYLLLETGGSMSLVTDIRYAYASEKETARTAFLQKYANYFG